MHVCQLEFAINTFLAAECTEFGILLIFRLQLEIFAPGVVQLLDLLLGEDLWILLKQIVSSILIKHDSFSLEEAIEVLASLSAFIERALLLVIVICFVCFRPRLLQCNSLQVLSSLLAINHMIVDELIKFIDLNLVSRTANFESRASVSRVAIS